MPVFETFQQFAERHGNDFVLAADQRRRVFRDGAVSDGSTHYDPPAEPRRLLLVQREYFQGALSREIEAFNQFKAEQLAQGAMFRRYLGGNGLSSVPPPAHDAVEQLELGKARYAKLRAELAAVNEQLEALRDPQEELRKAALQEAQERERQDLEARVSAIQNLTIE